MENWTVKAADDSENLSAAQREEAVQEAAAPEAEPQQEESYSTPTNDSGDFVVNLDQPVNTEEDAIQERETEEIPVGEQAGDSGEVDEGVREQSNEETAERSQDADFGIELVEESPETKEELQEVKEEPVQETVEAPAQPQIELPEGVDALVNFMNETGGTVEDFINLNKDVDAMDPVQTIKEYYKKKYPHYDDARITRKLDKQFLYDAEGDDPDVIQDKKDSFADELFEAREYLKSNKEKYYKELKSAPKNVSPEYQEAMNFYQTQQQQAEANQKIADNFQLQTDKVFNDEFKGFDFSVGDSKKYRVKVGDVAKTREYQKDINNFIGEFIGEDGNVKNIADYHKALFAAKNADKLAAHFYEQGRSDALKQSAAESKNIDMKPRQDAGSITTPSGNQFKVVSGDSSNKLRIKMRK